MVVTEVFYNPYIVVLAPESSAICETLCWSLLLAHVALNNSCSQVNFSK